MRDSLGDSKRRPGQKGFTLIETVVAMILVSAVALPASLWLYRSRVNHAAWERFQAVQLLEQRMNRAVILRYSRDWHESMDAPPNLRFDIRVVDGDGGRRLMGTARNPKGRTVITLEASLFDRGEP